MCHTSQMTGMLTCMSLAVSSPSASRISSRFSRVTTAQRQWSGARRRKGANVVKRLTVFIVLMPRSYFRYFALLSLVCSTRDVGRGGLFYLTLASTFRIARSPVWSESDTTGTRCSWLLIVNSGWIAMYTVSSSGTQRCVTSAAGHSIGVSFHGWYTELGGEPLAFCEHCDDQIQH